MESIPKYDFYKNKYGEELLLDVVSLDSINKYLSKTPIHTLSYYDITIITNNNGTICIDETKYKLKQGDVIFSMPNEIREWNINDMSQGFAIIFEEEFLLSFFNDPLFIKNLSFYKRNNKSAIINVMDIYPKIDNIIKELYKELKSTDSKDKHILRALLYELLTILNREYLMIYQTKTDNTSNRYCDKFIDLVDKNYKENHDTKFYAKQLCITPNYLNEVIHSNIGISAKKYIQERIIKEAKRMLSFTSMSVNEIAYELNYDNPSYFIRLFHKKNDITPLQYREKSNR